MNAARAAAELAKHAEAVCRRFLPRGRRQGRHWVAGNLDGDPGRSLFVRLEGPGAPGKWSDMATGEHGDLLDLIRHASGAPTLRAALAEARAFLALPSAPGPPLPGGGAHDPAGAALRLWRACRPIQNTHAERYLRARGLAHCRFASLRFHPALRYRERGAVFSYPALVAAVTGADGAIEGVQRTWLDPKRPAKANIADPRRALGRVFGHAVRFGTPGESLLVGEGIETTLSLVSVAPEAVAAAALSAGSFGAFAPPPGVARLLIARDNDAAGETAAERLARRCARAGVACAVLVPEGGDFNDDLLAFGPDALAARLAPWLRGGAVREAERRYRVAEPGKAKRRETMMRKANSEKADRTSAEMRRIREDFDRLNGDLGVVLVEARAIYHRMEALSASHEDFWAVLQRRDRIGKYSGQKRQLLEPTHGQLL